MSLKKNILFNYISQIYVIAISMLMLPKLLNMMGAEAYGIVGFFSMLQAFLMLLDLGMSATFSREIARYRAGVLPANDLLLLFGKLRMFFFIIGSLFLVVFLSFSGYLSKHWFKAQLLDSQSILFAIILIGLIVVTRWYAGFSRAIITGFEELKWLSGIHMIINTLRFVLVFIPLYYNATLQIFFTYQLIVAFLELVLVMSKSSQLLPSKSDEQVVSSGYLNSVVRFSVTIALTSAIWVFITQVDKLLLSKMLLLSEYGYFSLAVQLAGGLLLISGPISTAIIPRMTKLEAENKSVDVLHIYRTATQIIVVVVGSIGMLLVGFNKLVLYVWSNNLEMVAQSSDYLWYYAFGYFLLALSAFPYYLQYAKGDLTYHVAGNIIFVMLLVPSIYFGVKTYGGIGAAYSWLAVNIFYFSIWVPIIHHKFYPTLNRKWFLFDIGKPTISMLVVLVLARFILSDTNSRILGFVWIGVVFSALLLAGLFSTTYLRKFVIIKAKSIIARVRL